MCSIATGVSEIVLPGHSWILGDGKDINFWTDKWLGDRPLQETVITPLPEAFEVVKAHEVWVNGRGWNLEVIGPFIDELTRLQLGSVVLDNVTGAKDRLIWGETHNGRFSVGSAYALISRDMAAMQDMERFYDRIWKLKVPERVRIFLWLVSKQAIMTNQERHRRHLANSAMCQVCRGGVESITHILRDCPAMEGIWMRVLSATKRQGFFDSTILEWLYDNLSSSGVMVENGYWPVMFAIAVWWSWKWRCHNVFGGNRTCRDRVQLIRKKVEEVNSANAIQADSIQIVPRVDREIRWEAPLPGWFKVNTDGASRGNPGLATAGGVLRDEDGNWRNGFALNIGRCSAPLAELWGVYYGLVIAWKENIQRVELEVDSEIVVRFLKTVIEDSHPLSFLVRLCHGFISRDWLVRINHVYREGNCVADSLANHAFSLPLDIHLFSSVPPDVEGVLLDDVHGVSRTRNVRL